MTGRRYPAPLYLVNGVAQGIELRTNQLGLDLVGIEESADRALLNVDIDLGAHVIKLVRTIERRDSQKEIGSDSDVCHNDS